MRLYSGAAGDGSGSGAIDSSALEEALTLIKRRKENPSQVDFLDSAGGDGKLGVCFVCCAHPMLSTLYLSLSIYLSIYLSICLSTYLPIYALSRVAESSAPSI